MEYQCEYCGKSYLPKRTDSRYCSHTCRQLAYVLRKAQPFPSKGIAGEESDKLSVNEDVDDSKEQENISVNPAINVNEGKISVNEDEGKVQEAPVKTSTRQLAAKVEKEYEPYYSSFIEELAEKWNTRNDYIALYDLFTQGSQTTLWVSTRYRCLLECLLLFSEMNEIETDDLKEVCNAFTDLISSRHFKALPAKYPYSNEIKNTREKLKEACIEADEEPFMRFRLNREEKQDFMISRFDLSRLIRKKVFSQLNFKE